LDSLSYNSALSSKSDDSSSVDDSSSLGHSSHLSSEDSDLLRVSSDDSSSDDSSSDDSSEGLSLDDSSPVSSELSDDSVLNSSSDDLSSDDSSSLEILGLFVSSDDLSVLSDDSSNVLSAASSSSASSDNDLSDLGSDDSLSDDSSGSSSLGSAELLLKSENLILVLLDNRSGVLPEKVGGASADGSTGVPFAEIDVIGNMGFIVLQVVSLSSSLKPDSVGSHSHLGELSVVCDVLLTGISSPDWAKLHVSVSCSLIDLSLGKFFLQRFNLSHISVTILSIVCSVSLSVSLSSCSSLGPFTGVDQTSSSTLGGNHFCLPSSFLSLGGTGSHLSKCILSLGSICKFSNSLLDLRGVHFHGASRASWVTGTNLCLALEVDRVGQDLFAVSLT